MHYKLPKNSLADRPLPAVYRDRKVDLPIATSPPSGLIVRVFQPSQGSIDQKLRAITLFVRIVEKLGDTDSMFIGYIDPRIGNSFQKRILATHLIVQDPIKANDLGIHV